MDNKMTVFIDTNIFLDYIQHRPVGFNEAMKILGLSAKGHIKLLVSDLSIANIKYSTRYFMKRTVYSCQNAIC